MPCAEMPDWREAQSSVQRARHVARVQHGRHLWIGLDSPPRQRRAVASPRDVHDTGAALILASLESPEFPIPVGVLAQVDAPRYEEMILEQEQHAISDRGPGDIGKLLVSGDTWTIG